MSFDRKAFRFPLDSDFIHKFQGSFNGNRFVVSPCSQPIWLFKA